MIKRTSLKQLMAECLDYIEEESLLQKKAREMSDGDISMSVDRTPKCHPELAGEGIEYSWGVATDRIRKFSRRAREYIVAYKLRCALDFDAGFINDNSYRARNASSDACSSDDIM